MVASFPRVSSANGSGSPGSTTRNARRALWADRFRLAQLFYARMPVFRVLDEFAAPPSSLLFCYDAREKSLTSAVCARVPRKYGRRVGVL